MCIFTCPVQSVSATRIFARATSHGSQFLAYQMNYGSGVENAMILPVPIRLPVRADSLKFIDLKDYEEFFDDLDAGFPYSPPSGGIGCSEPVKSVSTGLILEVHKIGNYIASFVPSLADFSRLDARFTLPKKTWSRLPQYRDYGFAVFQLAAGSLKPHPMAFEFETANASIYFPTLHIHDGEIHAVEGFDHALYLQHAGFDSRVYEYQNSDVRDAATGLVRSKFRARQFCDATRSKGLVNANLLVHRKQLRGKYPNQDTVIATYGDPTKPTRNFRSLSRYWPWLVVVGAVAWLLARRNKLRRMKAKEIAGEAKSDDKRPESTDH